MVLDIKSNFKRQYSDTSCPLECQMAHVDNQENLLVCPKLKEIVNTDSSNHNYFFAAVKEK